MDTKLTPNSHRYKAEQADIKKQIPKVVSGNAVKIRKKSEMSKFKDSIFAEDISNVGTYLITDVLIPTVKKAIFEAITNGADMMLYGGNGRNKSKSPVTHVSYRDYSRSDSNPKPRTTTKTAWCELDEIGFEDRGTAEAVLAQMDEVLEHYSLITVADFYDMIDRSSMAPFTANKWGWTSIRTAEVVRGRGGDYYLKLPKPIPID